MIVVIKALFNVIRDLLLSLLIYDNKNVYKIVDEIMCTLLVWFFCRLIEY